MFDLKIDVRFGPRLWLTFKFSNQSDFEAVFEMAAVQLVQCVRYCQQ
jgi:hypothetical protein